MLNLETSRFNPKPGVMDFWTEFRKPNPYRWPILALSLVPFGLIFWWLSGETVYVEPERPTITYITTFQEGRSDAEIAASNETNQQVKELREAQEERVAQQKRDLYKALGAATGMDVESIEARAEAERAEAEAEEKRRQQELFGEAAEGEGSPAPGEDSAP